MYINIISQVLGTADFSFNADDATIFFAGADKPVKVVDAPNWDQKKYDELFALQTSMEFVAQVKEFVGAKIFAHASQNTQMNMSAAAAAGVLTDEQLVAFREGLQWIAQIRAKGVDVVKEKQLDFATHDWPEPSTPAQQLADAF